MASARARALHVAFELAAHGGVDAHAQGDGARLLALLVEHLGVLVEPVEQAALLGRNLERQDLVAARRGGRRSRPAARRSPRPVAAETSSRRALRPARRRCTLPRASPGSAGRSCSRPRGSAPSAASVSMPRSASTRFDVARLASVSACAMSRTCRMRSASITSSSVARKAATSMRRQVGDEADRVGQDDAPAARQAHLAHGRIERGEHLILGEHVGAGDAVEQRRLAGVGVADDGDDRIRHRAAALAVQLARAHDDLAAPCGWRRCAPRSCAGRARSALRRGRRGSRSRRAGAPSGSRCARGGSSDR